MDGSGTVQEVREGSLGAEEKMIFDFPLQMRLPILDLRTAKLRRFAVRFPRHLFDNLQSKIENLKWVVVAVAVFMGTVADAAEAVRWKEEWQKTIEGAKKEAQVSLYGGQEIASGYYRGFQQRISFHQSSHGSRARAGFDDADRRRAARRQVFSRCHGKRTQWSAHAVSQ